MNANRNLTIDFRINGKSDHTISKKKGRSIKKPTATKGKRG